MKQPLPNSTNYLGAYDRFGNLVRGTLGPQSQEASKGAQDASAQPAPAEKEGDEAQAPEGQESPDELEMAILRQEAKERKAKKDQKDENEDRLPPETVEDLRPFPLNRYFRSQPVLSEELREAIYQSVVSGGMTVPLASIHYGVSNERVGAVIRLKQMEKEWIAQVRLHFRPSANGMMKLYNIRLVFKTPTWLHNKLYVQSELQTLLFPSSVHTSGSSPLMEVCRAKLWPFRTRKRC